MGADMTDITERLDQAAAREEHDPWRFVMFVAGLCVGLMIGIFGGLTPP